MPDDLEVLRAIHRLSGGEDKLIRPSAIAAELGLSLPAVSLKLRVLAEKGLVELEPRRGARLTDKGREALAVRIWKESLLETLLHRLGVPLEMAEQTGRILAPRLPYDVAKVICEALGHPRRCPHGKEIPHPELGEAIEEPMRYCQPS